MKLEVGEYYLNANGEILELELFLRDELFIDTNGQKYDFDGTAVDMLSEYDLIAHIPKQLHLHILNEINSFYTDKDFKEVVNSVWGK